MRQILIEENDANMRMDRFLKKYLPNAPTGVLYKSLRKKNIVLNGKKAKPKTMLSKGDKIKIFFKDETIEKFQGKEKIVRAKSYPKIVADFGEIIIINKPSGLLSHSSQQAAEENTVDQLITYLIDEGRYSPEEEHTFVPSICNRLDRNTSGLIIGATSSQALREMNELIRKRKVKKFYLTIVHGAMIEDRHYISYLEKDRNKNIVRSNSQGIEAEGNYRPLKNNGEYTLVEVELITGRTHQIRHQLQEMGYPILGDPKYGKKHLRTNPKASSIKTQLLHAYKLIFPKLTGILAPLSEQEIVVPPEGAFKVVKEEIFGE